MNGSADSPDEKPWWVQWLRDRYFKRKDFRFVWLPLAAAAPGIGLGIWYGFFEPGAGWKPLWIGLAALWAALLSAVRSWIEDEWKYDFTELREGREDLTRLIGWIRVVVSAKSRRFSERLRTLPTDATPGDVFLEITKPDLQIKEIVFAIGRFFEHPPGAVAKVVLRAWDDKRRCLARVQYYPDADPPRSLDENFSDTSTVAGLAYFGPQLVICEDVSKDERFKKLSDAGQGSMFAYPVRGEYGVIFVVSVLSDKPGRFREADRSRISDIMQVFGDRLILENHLVELRRRFT